MPPPTHHDDVGASALGGANDRSDRRTVSDTNSDARPPADESIGEALGLGYGGLLERIFEAVPFLVGPRFA
jgi:hypothetical protein